MRQKSGPTSSPSERLVKNIRRATRKQYSAEEKIRIVLDGLRGESSVAEGRGRLWFGTHPGLRDGAVERSCWRGTNIWPPRTASSRRS